MLQLIPLANYMQEKDGKFILDGELKADSQFELPLLKIERAADGKLKIRKNTSLSKEEYNLSVSPDEIIIESSTETGAYYALQTLRQLSQAELGQKEIPCCIIKDKPRFSWRGLQLDESRHFFGTDYVKKLLDMMFMMKLNVFHWHLSDDVGWRIEIKKYPLLTEIGSKRAYTQINGWNSTNIVSEPYGGFYTQDQIKDIINYASMRGISIVPEIDFPAHCASAIAAYPWLACRELQRDVPGYFNDTIPKKKLKMNDWNRPICAGKDTVIQFVKDVADEVCKLFPAKYFHIGGDEAPKDEWRKCPYCQKRIEENKLANEEDLQSWFNNQVLSVLKKYDKRLIGWNEILKGRSLDKSVICQYWTPRKDRRAKRYANSGGSMIMSNHKSFYFDIPYAQYPLSNTYNYSLKTYGINPDKAKNILGVEAENWTEWTADTEKLETYMYPRIQALAEVAWTDESKRNFESFTKRLENFTPYFEHLGCDYAVKSVSMPKKYALAYRTKVLNLFNNGDTNFEVKQNKKYKLATCKSTEKQK